MKLEFPLAGLIPPSHVLAADDMDGFFATAANLVQTSASGASGEGASSTTQLQSAPEEVEKAEETFKAIMKMDLQTALHPGRISEFKQALKILAKAQIFNETVDASLQRFYVEFPGMIQSYDHASLELSQVNTKLQNVDQLRLDLAHNVESYLSSKTQMNELNKKKATFSTDIQTWDNQIQELMQKRVQADQALRDMVLQQVHLETRQKELFSSAKLSKNKLDSLVGECPQLTSSKEELENKLNNITTIWESFRNSLVDEF